MISYLPGFHSFIRDTHSSTHTLQLRKAVGEAGPKLSSARTSRALRLGDYSCLSNEHCMMGAASHLNLLEGQNKPCRTPSHLRLIVFEPPPFPDERMSMYPSGKAGKGSERIAAAASTPSPDVTLHHFQRLAEQVNSCKCVWSTGRSIDPYLNRRMTIM